MAIASQPGTLPAAAAAGLSVVGPRTFMLADGERIRLFDIVTPATERWSCIRECLLGAEIVDFLQRLVSRDDATMRVERYGLDRDGASRVQLFIDSRDVATLLIDRGFARPATMTRVQGWCSGP